MKGACNDSLILCEIWLGEKLEAEKRKKVQEGETSYLQTMARIESLIELKAKESFGEKNEELCKAPKCNVKRIVVEHRATHIERTAIIANRNAVSV